MTDDYTLDNVITFLKIRKEELNRQICDLNSRYIEADAILTHLEGIKKNCNSDREQEKEEK